MTTDVLNPVDVEQRIREIANRIAASVAVCTDRYGAFLKADLEYDREYARAFLNHEGPQTEKRYAAELETSPLREVRDLADVAYRHADRLSKALQDELRAYQSVGASVRSMYAVAGRGEN